MSDACLPSPLELMVAPELASLAAVEVSLELATRMLEAAHPSLGDDSPGAKGEPLPAQLALASAIRILAEALIANISSYRICAEQLVAAAGPSDAHHLSF